MKCEYGCNQEGKFQLKNKKYCCSSRTNKCPAIRKKNSSGQKRAYKEGRKHCGYSDKHRLKSQRTKINQALETAFKKGSSQSNHYLKQLMLTELKIDEKCSQCNITDWQGIKISLELDHIDGDSSNNVISNLRLLCPNCHSITEHWRGRNKNNGQLRVSDESLLECIRTSKNIRQALIKAGLSPRGGNYARAYKLSAQLETTDV